MFTNLSNTEKQLLETVLEKYRLINAKSGNGTITVNVQQGKADWKINYYEQGAIA